MTAPIIGIDLGTTNSVVAVTDATGTAHSIAGPDGERLIPSVVFFQQEGDPLIGMRAKQYAVVEPERVASLFKRGMGEEVFLESGAPFVVDGRTLRPEELSALVLRKLGSIANDFLGEQVERAVITVPAYFGEAQRAATRQAGELAGLDVVRIVNEPTAAAIAHGLDEPGTAGNILVFDLGGGTFDVTVLQRDTDGQISVLGSGGDRRLGGADFDQGIVERMITATSGDGDLTADPWALADAHAKAEEMKKELSTTTSSTRPLTVGGRPHMFSLQRSDFEELIAERLRDVEDTVLHTVEEVGLTVADIEHVLMVGGSSRIPAFRELLTSILDREPVLSRNLDEDVARGAAILAAKLDTGSEPAEALRHLPVPVDALTIGLGVSVVLGLNSSELVNEVVIAAGSPLPAQAERTFFTSTDDQRALDLVLNEGDDQDLDMVQQLGSSRGDFATPRPQDHPIRVMMEASDDGLVSAQAYDGQTNDFLAELEVRREGALTDAALDEARSYLASVEVDA